jgi:hypothetical protein
MRNFEQPCEWTRDQCRGELAAVGVGDGRPMDNKQKDINNENSF